MRVYYCIGGISAVVFHGQISLYIVIVVLSQISADLVVLISTKFNICISEILLSGISIIFSVIHFGSWEDQPTLVLN